VYVDKEINKRGNSVEVRIKPTKTLFFNEESYFGIYAVEVNPEDLDTGVKLNKWGNISIKGIMPNLSPKQEYTVILKEDTKSAYKGSYIVESIKQDRPKTIAEQRVFLESLLTENQVKNIFEVYTEEDDIVGLIEKGEFDYTKVHNLGEKTYQKLHDKVIANLDLSDVLTFLSKYGIKYNMISKLVKEYKNPQIVMDKIKTNPYLLTEVKGVGFKKADEIAKSVGYKMDSPHRINSCLWYILSEEQGEGHSWLDRKLLLNRAIKLLNITKGLIEEQLDNSTGKIIKIDNRYTTEAVYKAERFVAESLIRFKTQSKKFVETEELEGFLNEYCSKYKVSLEERQRQFFHDWNENNILFLIGGGGMGKSWLQRILLEIVDMKNRTNALLAPTGKASKVMASYTGREASTIHRKTGTFSESEESVKYISEDIVIVDESSMCDIFILSKLFKSMDNENARILFVGDDFQLPSVGVGNFLYDGINSGCIKVSQLKKVFRQKNGGILDIATSVRRGQLFLDSTSEGRIQFGSDCVFWLTDQDYVYDGIIYNYKKVLESYSQEDIIILSPTKKGKLGTIAINKAIQKIANPASDSKKEKKFGKDENALIYRVGDMVMNTANAYGMETDGEGVADIFNGDTGKIIDIYEDEKVFVIDFDGIYIKMKFDMVLTSLTHSWATTIHKSQGSQYPIVIVIVDKSMKYQLTANLLYTGFTRAQKFLLCLGQADAINHGIKKFANMQRRSFLQEMLHHFNEENPSKELVS
jgi:exodeoxyribonuclease V alpha subunit